MTYATVDLERHIETAELLGEAHSLVELLLEDLEAGEPVAAQRLDLVVRWLTKMNARDAARRRRHPDPFESPDLLEHPDLFEQLQQASLHKDGKTE